MDFNYSSGSYRKNKLFNEQPSHTTKEPKRPSRNKGKAVKIALYLLGGGFVLGLVLLVGAYFLLSRNLPDPNRLLNREVAQSTKLYDRTGETVIYEIYGDQKRTLVALEGIPEHAKWATIAIEDKNFYKHKGFSLWAIARTVITNVIRGRKAGGSTLTQQFVKNAVLTSEKTYTRKLKELILAYRLEKRFTKDQILQMYMNEIPYGSTAYGIEAASLRYFGKSIKDATLAESAILAALPQAPSKYSPYGPNKDLLFSRQQYILDQMVEQGYVSREKADSAKEEKIEFKEQDANITAPHFVMYVKEVLAEKYGEKTVEQGGLKIITTLDLHKQKLAEEVLKKYAQKNKTSFNAWNSSLVAIDPKNGQILAMVGSRDYFGKPEPENCISGRTCKFEPNDNVSLRLRQPGSSIKPIVYAAAFKKGYTSKTILYDVITNFSTDPEKEYIPLNYNKNENGPVSMKMALAGSLNIPAVKTLYLAGIDNVIDLAGKLGYTTLKDKDRLGLSLVLGGGEVKLVEHVNAFSAFARDGNRAPTGIFIKISNSKGEVLEEASVETKSTLEPEVARQINDILSDNGARSYVFSASNWLTLGKRQVAAKTGTTNDNRDAWTIGYTPSLVAGVWVGNNDNSQMNAGADGSVVAAPIWHDFMKAVLGETNFETFLEPKITPTGKPVLDGNGIGEKKVKIDKASGLLATELTPESFIEEKTFKNHHSILYYIDKNDPRGDYPQDPGKDPQFKGWESAVLAWASKKGEATSSPPDKNDNLHITANLPSFEISGIYEGVNITNPFLTASINGSATRGIKRVDYYIDKKLIESKSGSDPGINKNISYLSNGFHELSVEACDDIDNCSKKEVSFNLNLSGQENEAVSFDPIWTSPSNGLAAASIDFPISLGLAISNATEASKVEFFYRDEKNQVVAINSYVEPGPEVATLWNSAPASGVYYIYAIIYAKNGFSKKTKEITITINNIN